MKHRLIIFFRLLSLLLLSYFLLRLFFFIVNYSNFSFASLYQILLTFIYGLRFDVAAIAATNALFFIVFILPVKKFYSNGYQLFLSWLFALANIPFFLVNFVDIAYFHFTQKRTTSDFFSVVAMGNDFENMLPLIIRDYWWVLLAFLVFNFLFLFAYKKITKSLNTAFFKYKPLYWIVPALTAAFLVIAIRGGTQFKPISILTAATYTSSQNVGVVLNSTFTMIKTIGKEELQEIRLPNEIDPSVFFNPVHYYANAEKSFTSQNVVLIIMESFGKEYIGYFNNGKGYTPFLDSLMTKSFVCTSAFANGKKSIEGVPAIIAGLPALMNGSYISSVYNGNRLNSLPVLLKEKKYASAFFHGGNNGTMGFESFTRMAGYENYVGRNEYPQQGDYDGTWGIFDEPFFQFYCSKMSAMQQPFITTFFSLSSHHPYTIPTQYRTRFAEGEQPINKAVSYADYSLQQFFECAKLQSWYKNTLFVITADHTGPSIHKQYQTRSGIYSIPVIYYSPSEKLRGTYAHTTQQMDIVPSILDYLHYDQPFKFYGSSVFRAERTPFAISYLEGIYQIITDEYIVNFDGEKVLSWEDRKVFPNSSFTVSKDSTINLLKVLVADFNNSMIRNKLTEIK